MPGSSHQYQSSFLKLLSERGQLHDCTDKAALDSRMRTDIVTGYIGFDCTAPSLHIGSLSQIMILRRLQQSGHRPIVVMGGGTTKVGDPSGKDEARALLTEEQIAANKKSILKTPLTPIASMLWHTKLWRYSYWDGTTKPVSFTNTTE